MRLRAKGVVLLAAGLLVQHLPGDGGWVVSCAPGQGQVVAVPPRNPNLCDGCRKMLVPLKVTTQRQGLPIRVCPKCDGPLAARLSKL